MNVPRIGKVNIHLSGVAMQDKKLSVSNKQLQLVTVQTVTALQQYSLCGVEDRAIKLTSVKAI
jgi:hypothetical protein